MNAAVTLSAGYRIAVPADLCAARGWKPGQKLAFMPKGSGVMLMPVPAVADLFGIARGANPDNVRDRNDRY